MMTTTKSAPTASSSTPTTSATTTSSIILFYKYHPLSSDVTIVELYRVALEDLCQKLNLTGRILVGCNEHQSEGINGTLAGPTSHIQTFVNAMAQQQQQQQQQQKPSEIDQSHSQQSKTKGENDDQNETTDIFSGIIDEFWMACDTFYTRAACEPLVMIPSDFKWSSYTSSSTDNNNHTHSSSSSPLFPDLNIKIVKELIGTGGILAKIPLEDTGQGYLTPEEWHDRLKTLQQNQEKKQKKRNSSNKDDDGGNNNDDVTEDDDTILIDCRNTKEVQIGHFPQAVDPGTTTFNQFTHWVQNHKHRLSTKKTVLMYCTGGIRCEKASAYVRQQVPEVQEVRHLRGGIHKYLEAYPTATESLWQGKNFVFDNRGSHGLDQTTETIDGDHPVDRKDNIRSQGNDICHTKSSSENTEHNANEDTIAVVGKCRYCDAPYDSFDPHCICTVCREPILVCKNCQTQSTTSTSSHGDDDMTTTRREFHCHIHDYLKECYFTNLDRFSIEKLRSQLQQLQNIVAEIAVGKKFKQRRKTIMKQCQKIESRIDDLSSRHGDTTKSPTTEETLIQKCRNCGIEKCDGKCWGFHSLKRKFVLDEQQQQQQHCLSSKENGIRANGIAVQDLEMGLQSTLSQQKKQKNVNLEADNHKLLAKQRKEQQRYAEGTEWKRLGLAGDPSVGRDDDTGIRIPSPCIRTLRTTTKGKWCGDTLTNVLQKEFKTEFGDIHRLELLLKSGLVRVNYRPVTTLDEADETYLKNMDSISRDVYWVEPPVRIPAATINVQRVELPNRLFVDEPSTPRFLYVCDKPSTVPVHPAGPYLSNTLTVMVEAQEGLEPKSLIPCHRIDRVTSGLTICCDDVHVARLVQGTISRSSNPCSDDDNAKECGVSKTYLARVHGKFPRREFDNEIVPQPSDLVKVCWMKNDEDNVETQSGVSVVKVDGPIETVDPANGIRKVTPNGKTATSLFTFRQYDAESDTTLIECHPRTGRSHQLRLHLQSLGHSIVNDIQYGGSVLSSTKTKQHTVAKKVEMMFQERIERSSNDTPTLDCENETGSVSNIVDRAKSVSPLIGAICAGKGTGITMNDDHDDDETTHRQSLSERLSSTFTTAQLLQGGHEICLHALRYKLHLPVPKSNSGIPQGRPSSSSSAAEASTPTSSTVSIDLSVDLPSWADHL